jgi:hypothetical protein
MNPFKLFEMKTWHPVGLGITFNGFKLNPHFLVLQFISIVTLLFNLTYGCRTTFNELFGKLLF